MDWNCWHGSLTDASQRCLCQSKTSLAAFLLNFKSFDTDKLTYTYMEMTLVDQDPLQVEKGKRNLSVTWWVRTQYFLTSRLGPSLRKRVRHNDCLDPSSRDEATWLPDYRGVIERFWVSHFSSIGQDYRERPWTYWSIWYLHRERMPQC